MELGRVMAVAWSVALATAVPYLLTQQGSATPVALTVTDFAHVATGIALCVYLVAKVELVGVRAVVPAVTGIKVWQRWLSAALGVLYGGVLLSGCLSLVRWQAPLRSALAQVHLILAVWASILVGWHILGHVADRRALRRGSRGSRGSRSAWWRRKRWGAVSATLALPVVLAAAMPAAASEAAVEGSGARWSASGPATFLDAAAVDPAPRTALVGGSGLFAAAVNGEASRLTWRRVGPFGSSDLVLTLAVYIVAPASAPVASPGVPVVLAGAIDGLYGAVSPTGPYRLLTHGVTDVHGTARSAGSLWCSSSSGMLRSDDGGTTWRVENDGMLQPSTAWALTWSGTTLFGSDAVGVYRWSGTEWILSSDQRAVVAFDTVGPSKVMASSMGDGLRSWNGQRWVTSSSGLIRHDHGAGRGIHVVSVSSLPGRRYVAGAMTGGADESVDGGATWAPIWPELGSDGVVWRFVTLGSRLGVVTDAGYLSTPMPWPRPPMWSWWLLVAGIGTVAGTGGVMALAGGKWPGRAVRHCRPGLAPIARLLRK